MKRNKSPIKIKIYISRINVVSEIIIYTNADWCPIFLPAVNWIYKYFELVKIYYNEICKSKSSQKWKKKKNQSYRAH